MCLRFRYGKGIVGERRESDQMKKNSGSFEVVSKNRERVSVGFVTKAPRPN